MLRFVEASVLHIAVNTPSHLLPEGKYINNGSQHNKKSVCEPLAVPEDPGLLDLLCHFGGRGATGPEEVTELRPHQQG